jgi:hypothetical protein
MIAFVCMWLLFKLLCLELVLVNVESKMFSCWLSLTLPCPSPLNPCLPLSVHMSVRASAPRLAHRRAFAHSALMAISYPESISEAATIVEAVLLLETDRRLLNRRRVLNRRRAWETLGHLRGQLLDMSSGPPVDSLGNT